MKQIPITIPITFSSPEDLRLATEVVVSLFDRVKEQKPFGVLWLSPIEELLSPKIFQMMLEKNSSPARTFPQDSIYDCADSEARALKALDCGSKRIIYNGKASHLLKQIALGYSASLQKKRPDSFLCAARAKNSDQLLYSHIKTKLK